MRVVHLFAGGRGGESRFAWKLETHVQQCNHGNRVPLKQGGRGGWKLLRVKNRFKNKKYIFKQ